jgi:hypothetical protein
MKSCATKQHSRNQNRSLTRAALSEGEPRNKDLAVLTSSALLFAS